jgi:hypothetical protein
MGAGVQDDCYGVFAQAGLLYTAITGGGQGWGPQSAPMGYSHTDDLRYDGWEGTRWLTCVWMDLGIANVGSSAVPRIID